MGPEAMGITTVNLSWPDEKVCRNFLCGTCPHTLFTNTVRNCPACVSLPLFLMPSPLPFPPYVTFLFLENGSRSLPEITY